MQLEVILNFFLSKIILFSKTWSHELHLSPWPHPILFCVAAVKSVAQITRFSALFLCLNIFHPNDHIETSGICWPTQICKCLYVTLCIPSRFNYFFLHTKLHNFLKNNRYTASFLTVLHREILSRLQDSVSQVPEVLRAVTCRNEPPHTSQQN